MNDHPDEDDPEDILLKDCPDEWPPWWRWPWWMTHCWNTTPMIDILLKYDPDKWSAWWKTSLLKDHSDKRPPWWRPSWWATTLKKDHPSLKPLSLLKPFPSCLHVNDPWWTKDPPTPHPLKPFFSFWNLPFLYACQWPLVVHHFSSVQKASSVNCPPTCRWWERILRGRCRNRSQSAHKFPQSAHRMMAGVTLSSWLSQVGCKHNKGMFLDTSQRGKSSDAVAI